MISISVDQLESLLQGDQVALNDKVVVGVQAHPAQLHDMLAEHLDSMYEDDGYRDILDWERAKKESKNSKD